MKEMSDEDQLEVIEGVGQPGSQTVGEKFGIEQAAGIVAPTETVAVQVETQQPETRSGTNPPVTPEQRQEALAGLPANVQAHIADWEKLGYQFSRVNEGRADQAVMMINPRTGQEFPAFTPLRAGREVAAVGVFGDIPESATESQETLQDYVDTRLKFRLRNPDRLADQAWVDSFVDTLAEAAATGRISEELASQMVERIETQVERHNRPIKESQADQERQRQVEQAERDKRESEERERRENEREERQRQEWERLERERVDRERREQEERERREAVKEAEARRRAQRDREQEEREREEARKKGPKWAEQLGVIRLTAEHREEVLPHIQAYLEYFEANTSPLSISNFEDVQKRVAAIFSTLEAAQMRTNLGIDKTKEIQLYISARVLTFAAESFLGRFMFDEYTQCMSAFASEFKEHMTALGQAYGGKVALAGAYIESQPDYYNPLGQTINGQVIGERDTAAQVEYRKKLRATMIQNLSTVELGSGRNPADIVSLPTDRQLIDAFERTTPPLTETPEARMEREERQKQETEQSFVIAERLQKLLGYTSERGGPVIERADGNYLLFDDEVRRRAEIKAQTQGFTSLDYSSQLALNPTLRAREFGSQVSENEALLRLERRRQLYFDAVAEVRAENQGKTPTGENKISAGAGGEFPLKRIFYLPETIIPRDVKSQELIRFAELQMRSLFSELGVKSLRELMEKLKNGGVGRFDAYFWLGRLKGAEAQRNRFVGGKVGNDSYEGFLNQPMGNAAAATQAQAGREVWEVMGIPLSRTKSFGSMRPPERADFIAKLNPALKNFLAVVDGYYGYLGGRAPNQAAADYAADCLYQGFLRWLDGSEYRRVFNYPKAAREKNVRDAIEAILSSPPYLINQTRPRRRTGLLGWLR